MLRRITGRKPSTGPRAQSFKRANSASELESHLERLGRDWMYGFDLGHGVTIAPFIDYLAQSHETRWRMIEPELNRTFGDRWKKVRALDSACNEVGGVFRSRRLARGVLSGSTRDCSTSTEQSS
jgi:hypothetical protein